MHVSLLLAFGLLVSAPTAWASDGVREINQTCAVQTGCFAGDAPGFPVTIPTGGSYRLTSNLDLSALDPALSAISGTAPGIRLDLGGFEVRGPTTCAGSGPTISCSPGPLGTGGISFAANAVGPALSNGTVRGFARAGVVSEAVGLRVEGLTIVGNFDDGVAAVPGAIVRDSTSIENGRDGVEVDGGRIENVVAIGNGIFGIEIDGPGGVVRASTAIGNGSSGFELVSLSKFGKDNTSQGNVVADSCGGGLCTDKRRFYMTRFDFDGNEADEPGTCAPGFHFASVGELTASGDLLYDDLNGLTVFDSGRGAPRIEAWARTGHQFAITFDAPTSNCAAWSSSGASDLGTVLILGGISGDPYTGWRDLRESCDSAKPVWCVED